MEALPSSEHRAPSPDFLDQAPPRGPGTNLYRHREATNYKGVTKTSGTNSGIEKYDVQ